MSAISGIGGLAGSNAGAIDRILAMREQIIGKSQLLQQLHSARESVPAQPLRATDGTGNPAAGFAATLETALGGVSASQNKAANVMEAYQTGEVTDVAQVMLARQEAGVAFEAALQVRNKLLNAYQDIMRMGV